MEPTEENWVQDRWAIQRLWSLRRLDVWQSLRRIWQFIKSLRLELSVRVQIGLTIFVYVCLLWAVTTEFGRPIGLFDNLTITNWEDRRSFGLSIAGAVAPLLAIIGYILSAHRTKTMNADNEIKDAGQRQVAFAEALTTIDSDGLGSVGAIGVIAQIGSTDRNHTNSAIDILTGYLREKAKKPGTRSQRGRKLLHNEPTIKNEDSKRADGDKYILHIEAALNGLCALLNSNANLNLPGRHPITFLEHLDLNKISLRAGMNVSSIGFFNCSFKNSELNQLTFWNVHFNRCNLTSASFTNSNFVLGNKVKTFSSLSKSCLDKTVISNTDFKGVTALDLNQLESCRYSNLLPPLNLPRPYNYPPFIDTAPDTTVRLATYFKFDIDHPDGGVHESREKCELFWTTPVFGKYRPKTRHDDLAEIVYPPNATEPEPKFDPQDKGWFF